MKMDGMCKLTIVAIALYLVIGTGVLFGGVWVAWHFIAKYW